MNDIPSVQPLSYSHRTWFFRFLVTFFLISVPIFIFYAMGYRVNLFENPGTVMTVGGMFISADTEDDTQIYVNEILVDNYRLFQKAAYIQNLPAGVHRVHVQGVGLQTWVKELPVYAHIVTEANAFNMPVVPQLRVVTQYSNAAGQAIVIGASSSLPASGTVEYRNQWLATTSKATTTLQRNSEYNYLLARFASSTEAKIFIDIVTDEIEQFRFAEDNTATSVAATTTSATTTKVVRDRQVQEVEGGLMVSWTGSESAVPYYFCVPYYNASSTLEVYGHRIIREVAAARAALQEPISASTRDCRRSITVGGDWQEIYSFDFYPNNPDLLVLQRSDGIVIKEIDDRAWQNTQVLYPAGDYEFITDGNRFYIKQDQIIFEILTSVL